MPYIEHLGKGDVQVFITCWFWRVQSFLEFYSPWVSHVRVNLSTIPLRPLRSILAGQCKCLFDGLVIRTCYSFSFIFIILIPWTSLYGFPGLNSILINFWSTGSRAWKTWSALRSDWLLALIRNHNPPEPRVFSPFLIPEKTPGSK